MANVQVDYIQNTGNSISSTGSVAQRLLQSGFNVNALRTQEVLRKEEWINFDQVIIEVARKRLIAVGDLVTRGLVFPVSNALGTTKVEWEKASDLTDATISMGGITEAQNDRQTFELVSVPLPIIHKDFRINIRALESSRNLGMSLDTSQAALASRIVSEKIESLLFNGSNVAGTSNKIFGYTTHPDRITGSLSGSWATATGTDIIADTLNMIEAAAAKNMYGPFVLYTSVAANINLGNDFKAESDRDIMERLKAVPGVEAVQPSSDIASSEVVMVQMTSDVVDMIEGIQPTMIHWETHGGMMLNFKVMAVMVPRIKSDKEGQSGVIHFS